MPTTAPHLLPHPALSENHPPEDAGGGTQGEGWAGKITGEGVACLILESHLQNILKRTAQGSQDEDMATKAFNALKEVSSVGQGCWAPDRLSWTPSMSLTEPPAVGVSDPWAEA